MKACCTCSEIKPLSEYHSHKGRKDGKSARCKPCAKEAASAQRKRNGPEKMKDYHLRQNYGITIDDFSDLWKQQEGRCAICSRELTLEKKGHAVDHNHENGEVRGLLCSPCNLAIGLLQDNPDTLLAGARYLQEKGHYGP